MKDPIREVKSLDNSMCQSVRSELESNPRHLRVSSTLTTEPFSALLPTFKVECFEYNSVDLRLNFERKVHTFLPIFRVITVTMIQINPPGEFENDKFSSIINNL